jgi:endonuclease YncB( thermonuclease family)
MKLMSWLLSLFCIRNSDRAVIKKLKKIENKEDLKCFSFKGKTFWGIPTNVYDGDTLSMIFLHDNKHVKYRCRCLGYDSPEMKPSLQDINRLKEKELAVLAKNRFKELLDKNPDGVVRFYCSDFDKYGRLLVNIWNGVDEKSINEIMVEEGHGKKYDGGTKEKWT